MLKSGIIKNDEKCMELLTKATEMQAELGEHCMKVLRNAWKHLYIGVFACGGITRDGDRTVISNSSCYFVPDQGKWYHLTSMNKGRHYHGATTDKGYVLCCWWKSIRQEISKRRTIRTKN